MLAPNTILQNRYRVVRKLGQGGMGAIYEAIDERVSCLVALKETLVGSDPQTRDAFHREAALLANLRHPSLPKVMDYFGEGDGEFLVMEFIPGHDLAELMTLRDGPFPQLQVINWAIEIVKLLEYLHTHDPPILHRDIKPANLKVTAQGEVFLLDFGLAKGAAGQMTMMETSRSVPGYTPLYAPLEQILYQGTDPRSDLYALGATLYHLLTAQAPVSAPARFDAIENNQADPQKSASQVNVHIAPEFAACIHDAMALGRRDRPASASEMRIALENAAKVIAHRDAVQKAEARLRENLSTVTGGDPAMPPVQDEDVQFTVYTPQTIKPEKTYSVLAFAHLSKRRADSAEDEPDPIEEVKNQAARLLGNQRDDYQDARDSSSQPVPRGGELTFVPVVKGLNFSPSSRSFNWVKSVHREEFDVRASAKFDGQTLKGSMTVFLGSVVIAEVGLTISVDSRATPDAEKISLDQASNARRLRQVFACYSHKDERVVAELAHVAPIFGSRFLLDRTHLDPGEDRIEGLQRLIRSADIFQLFWSTNSMRSSEAADEIRYAVSLRRPGFILPTYWEEPVPRSPSEGLPPPEIDRLQFYRIYPGAISQATLASTKRDALESSAADRSATGPLTVPDDAPTDELASAYEPRTGELTSPPYEPPTGELTSPPITMPVTEFSISNVPHRPSAIVVCATCGMTYSEELSFCTHCGTRLSPTQALGNELKAAAAPLPTQNYQAPPLPTQSYQAPPPPVAKRNRGMMIPIFASAAMVLLAVIVAPLWFMMNSSRTASVQPAAVANGNSANTNTTANINRGPESIPAVEFVGLDGVRRSLKDFRGRVVLLNFWSTSSTPSQSEIPVLNDLERTLGPRGLSVIGLSADDTADQVTRFQKATPQAYQVGLVIKEDGDPLLAAILPTTYILDRGGKVRKKMIGRQSRAAFESAIQPLINERP